MTARMRDGIVKRGYDGPDDQAGGRRMNGLPIVGALLTLYLTLILYGLWRIRVRERRREQARVERFERHKRTITEVRR